MIDPSASAGGESSPTMSEASLSPGGGPGQQPPSEEKPRRDARLIASGVLGVLWSSLPPLAGIYIFYDLEKIAAFLKNDLQHGFWAYVAVFAISAGLGFLPTYSQAFLGGWVFGMQWGLLGAIMGFTGGAGIGYLFSRFVTGDSVDRWINRHPKGRVIRDALTRGSIGRTMLVATLLRVPPTSPFAMTNYALSATKVPFWIVMLTTPVGMLPRTAIVCILAASAVEAGATNLKDVFKDNPWWMIAVTIVSSVLVILIIGQIAQKALERLSPVEPSAGAHR